MCLQEIKFLAKIVQSYTLKKYKDTLTDIHTDKLNFRLSYLSDNADGKSQVPSW